MQIFTSLSIQKNNKINNRFFCECVVTYNMYGEFFQLLRNANQIIPSVFDLT